MKKLVTGLAIVLGVCAVPAVAQTVTYACQYVKTAGLNWENGRWIVGTFNNQQPFILTATDGSLVPLDTGGEGAFDAKFNHPLYLATCLEPEDVITDVVNNQPVSSPVQSCISGTGEFFVFDFDNLTGTYSLSGGGTGPRSAGYKDSLVVAPFVCQTIR